MRCSHAFLIAALLSTSPALGQLPNFAFSGGGGGTRDGGFQGTATFRFPPSPLAVVAGAPYSGEQTEEVIQVLADGNTITHSTGFHQKAWRDSQGRIRIERSAMAGASRLKGVPKLVEIQDPVAGYAYIMDDVTRVVHRMKLATVVRPSAHSARPTGNLGSRVIDGIEAVGTRSTTTYPPNSVSGNDTPITVTREEWKSPELQLTILIITSDPRQGTTTSKIANLSRIEPDPTLFFIPSAYTVVDEKQSFTIKWGVL